MKNFDDLLSQDRTFQVGGETFKWRDVRPEVLTSFTGDTNGDAADDNAVWRLLDGQILLFIEPSEADRWTAIRARDDNPVTIVQLNSILTWLLEQQTGRPTETPSPSAAGRGPTAATSKAK